MNPKPKFSIIGSGLICRLYDKNHPLYIKLKEKEQQGIDFMDYIDNYRTIESLNLRDANDYGYKSLFEIAPSEMFTIYSRDIYTRLEVKHGFLRTTKVFFKYLKSIGEYLFPPKYIHRQTTLQNPGLLILETDKGRWGSTIQIDEFEGVNPFAFELIAISETAETYIKSIWYNERLLNFKQPDTLCFGIRAFLI